MKDYYKILGVSRDASQEDIEKAFKKLAHQHHPDKKGGDAQKFKEISEAYSFLKNPENRRQENPFGGGFEGFGSHINVEDIFEQVFSQIPRKGQNVEVLLKITLEEAVFGVEKKVKLNYRTKPAEEISLIIKPNSVNGDAISLPGKGEAAPANTRSKNVYPGDLFVVLRVEENKPFFRTNNQLLSEVILTPSEAVLGTTKTIVDLKGEEFSIKIPANSYQDSIIRVSGRGIPKPYGNGELHLVTKIDYPSSANSKVKELFKEIGKEKGW